MNNKKGEMTTQQIVTLIILIASFAVILFFLFRLNLGTQNEKDICHNSVLTRSSSILSKDLVPLDCKRQYICITEDGSCETMTKPIIKKVKSRYEIYQILAEELADCWWMFGEGKVNYVGKDFKKNLYCSLCAQIAFDDSVKKLFGGEESFDYGILKEYMTQNNMSGSEISYSEYLYGTNNLSEIYSGDFGKIDLNKQYYVMMGMHSKINALGYIATGAAAVGTAATLIFATVSTGGVALGVLVFSAGAVAGGSLGNYIGAIVQGDSGLEYMPSELIEANSEEFKSLKCAEISTLA